jgi:nitrobindin-like protein
VPLVTGDLHPDLTPSPASGRGGEGKGEYPTIESFAYGEEVRFWHVGKPFLFYAQRTWSAENGRALHGETGYWRSVGDGRLELVLAHALGITEISEGRVAHGVVRTVSHSIRLSSTAKSVTRLERKYELDGDVLHYELHMAAVGQPLAVHLRAELKRISVSP